MADSSSTLPMVVTASRNIAICTFQKPLKMGLLYLSSQNVENLTINTTVISERFCIFEQIFQDWFLSKHLQAMMLSEKLKEQRKQCNLPQRKVAAALDIDTATYCKIENGNYSPKREQVIELASILNIDEKELLTLWQADQFSNAVSTDYQIASDAMQIACEQYRRKKWRHPNEN